MSDVPLTIDQRLIVSRNMDLAHHLAKKRWLRSQESMDLAEVTSIAYQGLMQAAQSWDPTRPEINPEDLLPTPKYPSGKAFAGYAHRRIEGSILDWQRNVDHVQRSYRSIYKMLKAAGYGNGTSMEELAQITGVPEAKIRAIIRAVETTSISLDSSVDTWGESISYGFELAAEHNVEASAAANDIMDSAAHTIMTLPPLQQTVLALRYYLNQELQVIAAQLELPLTTVRVAHTEALATLYDAMRKKAS